ncbi:hypothetical protein ACFT5B_19200 [Luteimicrobium sp. NPDC057192]|uniref:hypothetical protein n=1 Tax=Luteimicrobium sp. NPDC057192 TaxID=3346042 RepID=UPI00362CE834
MHLTDYLLLLRRAETVLATGYRTVSEGHAADADVHFAAAGHADRCDCHARDLAAAVDRLPAAGDPPERFDVVGLGPARTGPAGLLRDLLDLYLVASLVDATRTAVLQAAKAKRDTALVEVIQAHAADTAAQLAWLTMTVKATAPQTLLVA